MNKLFYYFLVAICITYVLTNDSLQVRQKQDTIDSILDVYIEKGNSKELFKVWHSLYNIQYDYNTEEGIKKYKTFKANLKSIQEHNSKKDESYTQWLNEFSDKSPKELE